MLRTHNIGGHNFSALFLNIVKRGKQVQIKNLSNIIFSQNFYHWFSEEIWNIKCRILQLLVLHQTEVEQLSITSTFIYYIYYINNHNIKNSFRNDKMIRKSFGMVWLNKSLFLHLNLASFFSLMEIWGWLTHFSITNFWCIYDCTLKKVLTASIFNMSTY